MTEKRFTLTYEKIGKYFDIGIVDHEEPFDDTTYEFHQCSFQDSKDEMEDLTQLLNALHEENVKLRARNKYLATKIQKENEQLKQQVEDLEFKLRTIKAYDRTVKEEHSDTVYDFQKKLEKW